MTYPEVPQGQQPPTDPGQPPHPSPPPQVVYVQGPPPVNSMAITALVSSLVLAPLGIIFGHIALNQIKRSHEGGRGLAIGGLVIGYLFTAIAAAWGVFLLVAVNSFLHSDFDRPRSKVTATSQPRSSPARPTSPSRTASPSRPTVTHWRGTWTGGGKSLPAGVDLDSITPISGDITIPGKCAAHWTEISRISATSRVVRAHVTSGDCGDNRWNVTIGTDEISGVDTADSATTFSIKPQR